MAVSELSLQSLRVRADQEGFILRKARALWMKLSDYQLLSPASCKEGADPVKPSHSQAVALFL